MKLHMLHFQTRFNCNILKTERTNCETNIKIVFYFNLNISNLSLSVYIYIYICVYVCVYVCVDIYVIV
jgi:hypothetical protein